MTQLPDLSLYRRGTALSLVLAPAIFLLDNVLHPKEYTRDHEAEQLAEIADSYELWQLAHLLGFVAIVLFAAVVLGLAFMVRRRQPRFGLVAGTLGLVGLMGLAAVITIDGYTWGILGEVSGRPGVDKATVELALNDVQQSEWSLPYYAAPLAWIVGLGMLAIGAVRQGALPMWAGGLLALGVFTVGLEPAIQDNAYFIASAAMLLIGGAAVALQVWRMSDAEFAGERRSGPRAGTAAA